jgi:CBS-domain-containing membrane protein
MASGLAVRHLVALVCNGPVALESGGWPPLISASLALALTCLVLVRLSAPHAPACASALILAVGGVQSWPGVAAMAAAVLILTFQAICVSRIAGVDMPTWSHRPRNTTDL